VWALQVPAWFAASIACTLVHNCLNESESTSSCATCAAPYALQSRPAQQFIIAACLDQNRRKQLIMYCRSCPQCKQGRPKFCCVVITLRPIPREGLSLTWSTLTSPGWKQGFLATITVPWMTCGSSSKGLESICRNTWPSSSTFHSSTTPISRQASGTNILVRSLRSCRGKMSHRRRLGGSDAFSTPILPVQSPPVKLLGSDYGTSTGGW